MTDAARRDVFQAIADPTRRKIIDLLATGTLNLNTIAAQLEMTQPAISQQVKILRECGVIEVERIGRERYCKVDAKKLIPAFLWLERHQKQWTDRIDSFEIYVNKLKDKPKT